MRITREQLRRRREQWERFARWRPPDDPEERATRLAWLEEVVALARARGLLADPPPDDPETLAHRRRLRDRLARIRVRP